MAAKPISLYPVPFTVTIPAEYSSSSTQQTNLQALADGSTVRLTLEEPLYVDNDVYASWSSISVSFTQPNVGPSTALIAGNTTGNNRISITWGAQPRTDYYFPTGLYGFDQLATRLNIIALTATPTPWITSLTTPLFSISFDAVTKSTILNVLCQNINGGIVPSGGVVIDFINPSAGVPTAPALNDSIGSLLGWPMSSGDSRSSLTIGATATAATTYPVSFVSPLPWNLFSSVSYNLNMSIIHDSSYNGSRGQLLVAIPTGSAGFIQSRLIYENGLVYDIPVQSGVIKSIDIWFTDEDNVPLKMSGFSYPTLIAFYLHKGNNTVMNTKVLSR